MLKKALSIIFSVLIIASLGVVSVSANSAQTHWSGVDASGMFVKEENCPLEVKSELLTFDISEFPEIYYETAQQFLDYSAKVTAEYVFKNPADYTVNATLVFPFGNAPDYIYYDEESRYSADTEKFDITVNGEVIEKKLRHTLSYGFENFDYDEASSKLHDEFVTDEFFSPDTPVKVYVFEINEIDEAFTSAYTSAPLSVDPDKSRIILADCSIYNYQDNAVYAGLWAENKTSFTMYVIGEDIDKVPEWTVYEDASEENTIDVEVKLLFTDDSTFKDIALMFHREESGVSEIDWYNAIVDKANYFDNRHGFLGADYEFMIGDSLMRWYEYELTVKSGETVTNTVTAPIYPSIDQDYTPSVYGYTYLLSPAKNWASFGTLDIVINTPYYITENNLGKLTHSDNTYTISLDSLPDSELEFTLCSEENPEKQKSSFSFPIEIIAILSFVIFIIVLILCIVLVVIIYKNKHLLK